MRTDNLWRLMKMTMAVFVIGVSALSCTGQKQAAEETVTETTETVTETVTTAAVALTSPGPARNPYLAADKYSIAHFDPAQTDTMPYPAKRGAFNIDLNEVPRVVGGPINIMTFASTSPDYMWGVSSEGVTYIDVSNGGFREAARLAAPGVKVIPPEVHNKVLGQTFTSLPQVEKAVTEDYGLDSTRIANGAYSLVDRDNVVYASYGGGSIFAFGLVDAADPAAGIKVLRSLDVSGLLGENERVTGLGMTYDGKLIILGNRSMRTIDRSLTGEPVTIQFGEDEYISNSVAVDEKGGIYVASDTTMYKVVWTGSMLSRDEADGAWSAPYDSGEEPPSVKFGKGTGSTPTLMGFGNDPDKLVVITDGADHMNLVAFWRDDIPAGFQQDACAKSSRIAGQIQVTCGLPSDVKFIQSEQSVVVNGYGAFVVNNIRDEGAPDRLVDVMAGGPVFPPPAGAERFEWDPDTNTWSSVWARSDVVSTSMVPTLSAPSGIVFVNGYTKKDGWEVTGMDWATGETVHRTIFGQSNLGNGSYAIIQLFPNSDMLFNSIGGPARIHY